MIANGDVDALKKAPRPDDHDPIPCAGCTRKWDRSVVVDILRAG
jgi:hypothetical protein